MEKPSEVRARLESLTIPKESRPTDARRGHPARAWIVLLILAGLGGVGFVQRQKILTFGKAVANATPKIEVKPFLVALTPEPDPGAVLTATGKIVSDHRVQVATKVSGQIIALHFEQGDRVLRGQLLARLEDTLYRARRDEAAARLSRAQSVLEFQKVNFARVESLIKGESAPPIEYADALRALQEAQSLARADQAALDWTQKSLDDTQVTAPIDGVVLSRNVEVGDYVSAEGGRGANSNAQFATIADMQRLRVEIDISELDIARIRQGMPCTIRPDAYKDRRYQGSVMWLDPGANYSKATVQVKVRIEQPDEFLRIEGSAEVAFFNEPAAQMSQDRPRSIWIPGSAVFVDQHDGRSFVLMKNASDRWKRTEISLGPRRGVLVQVLKGLSPGDFIATEGVETLRQSAE